MPVISGVEVGLQLKACHPGLRLLFTSGYPVEFWENHDAERVRGLPSDSMRILQKPFSPAVLIGNVDELIGPA